jgi:outer membrane lipoprotein-sorting protein
MTRAVTRGLFAVAAVLTLLLTGAACKGGGQEADLTAGQITDTQLASMMLSLEDYGPDFRDFQLDKDSGLRTAAQTAENDFDPQDEAQDLERFGWASGYGRSYLNQQAAQARSGIFAVSSDVALFDTADGAAGYFDDSMTELAALLGNGNENITIEKVGQFDAHVADDAAGFYFSGSTPAGDGSQIRLFSTGVALRRGRLLGTVGFVLARMLDQRIVEVLQEQANGSQGSEPLVMRPGAVLATSSERFTQEVQTFQGTFEADMSFGDFHMDTKGTFAFRSPDTMYMTMNIMGKTVEYLMVAPDMYMRFPNEGWYVISGESLGINREALRQYLANRGPVDYAGAVPQLRNVTQLPDETLEGVTYIRYKGTLDLAQMMEEIPQGIYDPALLKQAQDSFEPITMEVWLDKDTYLPRRVDETMTFNVEESGMSMDMSMEFSGFNEPVIIPEPPQDAEACGAGLGSA